MVIIIIIINMFILIIYKKEPKINYKSIKQSQNILVGHDIKNYYFFENDNFKKDWESKV